MASPSVFANSPQKSPVILRAVQKLNAFYAEAKPSAPSGIPFPSHFDAFLSPLCPLILGLAYVFTVQYFNARVDGKNRLQFRGAKLLILSHNLLLALYSAWTFINVAPAVASSFYEGYLQAGKSGLTHAFCDSQVSSNNLWHTIIAKFGYIFYLSKYYEFIDSWIILLKGKKVDTLQCFHHAGAVLTMWAGMRLTAPPVWLFIVFNSFIHTLMYTYYTFSVLKLPFPRFLKQSLTSLQITQFLVGGSLGASYLFINLPSLADFPGLSEAWTNGRRGVHEDGMECLGSKAARVAVWMNLVYLAPLTYLFADFYRKSYSKKKCA